MTSPRQHPRRRGLLRRPPAVHQAPPPPAPVSPEEVLERAPDVSRETFEDGPVVGAYVAGGQVPSAEALASLVDLEPPPPLRKDQVAHLEAITAQWTRQVRLEVPADATMVYPGHRPPVPPARAFFTYGEDGRRITQEVPPPAGDLELAPVTPAPVPAPVPGPARRVSDWSSRHDARSLEYAVRARLHRPVPLQDLLLERGPVLDQGTTPPQSLREASACTGFAAVAAANVLELESGGPARLEAADARAAYRRAQELDSISGEDYAGTSVLAVMKAGQEYGWWDAYLWALGGTRDVAQALLQLRAPVVVGIPWPASMEEPDAAGIVTPAGPAAGGHALAVVGLSMTRAGRPGPWFVLQQSRGTAEGNAGLIYLHHAHLAALLAGRGEAAVPLPRYGQ